VRPDAAGPAGPHDLPSLRRVVLEVSVRHDVDVRLAAAGVELTGPPAVLVPWPQLADVVHGDPGGAVDRMHAAFLLAPALVGTTAAATPRTTDGTSDDQLGGLDAVACALPPGHALHPGPAWVRLRVPGGLLEVGVAVRGGPDAPVLPLPPSLAPRRLGAVHGAAGTGRRGPTPPWPPLAQRLERAGALAAGRLTPRTGAGVLRPVDGHDALTLLASRAVRAAIAALDGTGLRALAVPSRRRAWFDDRHLDPAFVAAAWLLTPVAHRGLAAPVLVTRDEVAAPAAGRTLSR
jgi:hypothetical protein